jgi:tetratricopeptide (TPR) repeat protein
MSESATLSPLSENLQATKALILQKDFARALEALHNIRAQGGEVTPQEQEEMLYQMGVCLNGLERPLDAINFLNRSLKSAENLQDFGGMARSLEELGGAHHQRGDLRSAESHFLKAHALYLKHQDPGGTARGFRNLAGVRVDGGQIGQAVKDFETAREMFSKLEDSEGVATCVTNMALLTYRHKGRVAAIADYEAQLAKGDANHFLVFNNLGFLQLMEEKLEDAKKNLSLGLTDCEARGVKDDNAGLLHLNLGIVEALQGNLAPAKEHLEKAAAVFAQFPVGKAVLVTMWPKEAHEIARFAVAEDGHKMAVTWLNMAVVEHLQGNTVEAINWAKKAIELDKEEGYPYAVLGWLYRVSGDQQAAGHSFRRAQMKEPSNHLYKAALDQTNPYLNMKIGRNDPCPCGSGKKFKKCHGAG